MSDEQDGFNEDEEKQISEDRMQTSQQSESESDIPPPAYASNITFIPPMQAQEPLHEYTSQAVSASPKTHFQYKYPSQQPNNQHQPNNGQQPNNGHIKSQSFSPSSSNINNNHAAPPAAPPVYTQSSYSSSMAISVSSPQYQQSPKSVISNNNNINNNNNHNNDNNNHSNHQKRSSLIDIKNKISHPIVKQLVDMGFPENYVQRACKIFRV